MKNPFPASNTNAKNASSKAFTLMETVIAIGVLAVLLTGFIAVFAPAAQGIRRSISTQQADRLTTALEKELVTLRIDSSNTSSKDKDYDTGFEKAFNWLKTAGSASEAIFVYQYRGDLSQTLRDDGTPEPLKKITGQPGEKYTTQSMARLASDDFFKEDLTAIEGAIFYVKPIQLVQNTTEMNLGVIGTIENPAGTTPKSANNVEDYKDAVIAFSAEFYSVPSKSVDYIENNFATQFANAKRPVFTRNLAVRR